MNSVLILVACALCGVAMGSVSASRYATLPVLIGVSAVAGVCWWLMLRLPIPVAAASILWCLVYELACLISIWSVGTPPHWYNLVGGILGIIGVALLSI